MNTSSIFLTKIIINMNEIRRVRIYIIHDKNRQISWRRKDINKNIAISEDILETP